MEDRSAALEEYRHYLEQIPELVLPPGIRFRIAAWLAETGEGEAAYRAFVESVPEEGGRASAAGALYRAGHVALEQLGSPLHARAAWERLLEQFPDSTWSENARISLRTLPEP